MNEPAATSDQIIDAAGGFWHQLDLTFRLMLLPSRINQIWTVLFLIVLAHLLAWLLAPRLRKWLRRRQGWPKWRLRTGLMVVQRLRLILFSAMAWTVVLVMRQVTWPSLSQLIAEAATIATAILAIAFLARLIVNSLFRRVVRWAAWIWAVLYLLGLTDATYRLLDSLALGIGSFRLSLLTALKALAVITLLIAGSRLITRAVSRRLSTSASLTPTMQVLVTKLVQVILITLAFAIGLRAIGVDLTGIAVFSGAVGVGLGFGLQKVVSNLVSGIIILLDKSIKPGDVISLGDTFGWIDALGARYVSVVTRDGKEYLIPNEDLVTSQVVNWSHTNDFVRLDVEFTASCGDDPHKVSKIAINAALTVKRVLAQRTPVCWITGLEEGRIQYVLRFWISDAQRGLTNVRGQVFLALWDAFQDNGITIPFPQREVRLLNDDPSPPKFIAGD